MLLLDQPPLPVDTAIVFDVSLSTGEKLIRAEAVVLGFSDPGNGQPGGIRVRFKRYGAATKAFIDRACGLDAAPLPSFAPAASLLPSALPPRMQQEPPPNPEPLQAEQADPACDPAESSGVHRKAVLPVEPPVNREALLNRLRARRAG